MAEACEEIGGPHPESILQPPQQPRPQQQSWMFGATASKLNEAALALAGSIDTDGIWFNSLKKPDEAFNREGEKGESGGYEPAGSVAGDHMPRFPAKMGKDEWGQWEAGGQGRQQLWNSRHGHPQDNEENMTGRLLLEEETRRKRWNQLSSPNYPFNSESSNWGSTQYPVLPSRLKDIQDGHTDLFDVGSTPFLPNRMRPTYRSEEDPFVTTKEKKRAMNRRKRVVMKGGSTNICYKNISKKRRRYFSDIFTTLLDSSWAWLVLMFAASFYLTWILFAVLYYISCYYHGDLLPEHLPPLQGESGWTPCILEIDGFAASFLFSLETQHTIGYGSRQTTTECPDTMIMASIQSVLGCLIQAFMVGLVFSKLSRPGSRSRTVIFSQNAVITMRNRRLCLIFRIGDLRDDNFILGTQISAKVLRRRITQEGEQYEEMQKLNVVPDSSSEPCIFFVWPLEVVHIIDEESPFYDLSATDLSKEKFEIAVVMEGCIETTSMNFQARTSYLPSEILWGSRFEPMMLYRKDHNEFQVNFSAFHSTYDVTIPKCSARELDQHYRKETLSHHQASRAKFSTVSQSFPTDQDNSTGPDGNYLGPSYIPRSHSVNSRVPEQRKTTHANLPISPLVLSNSSPHQQRYEYDSSTDSSQTREDKKISTAKHE